MKRVCLKELDPNMTLSNYRTDLSHALRVAHDATLASQFAHVNAPLAANQDIHQGNPQSAKRAIRPMIERFDTLIPVGKNIRFDLLAHLDLLARQSKVELDKKQYETENLLRRQEIEMLPHRIVALQDEIGYYSDYLHDQGGQASAAPGDNAVMGHVEYGDGDQAYGAPGDNGGMGDPEYGDGGQANGAPGDNDDMDDAEYGDGGQANGAPGNGEGPNLAAQAAQVAPALRTLGRSSLNWLAKILTLPNP